MSDGGTALREQTTSPENRKTRKVMIFSLKFVVFARQLSYVLRELLEEKLKKITTQDILSPS